MAGYSDTRQLIIDTLMGRPAGTEIQPEDHQAFALQITDYVRAVELVAGNATPIGFADASTVPVQPDNGQAVYLSQVNRGTTVTFANFIDQDGNAISVTSDSSSVTFVTLLWNGQYWSKQTTVVSASVLTAETFRVTFTESAGVITASDTGSAIDVALRAGKYIYAYFHNEDASVDALIPFYDYDSNGNAVFFVNDDKMGTRYTVPNNSTTVTVEEVGISVLRVVFTQGSSAITSSDTFYTIQTAYNAKKNVYAVFGNNIYPLIEIDATNLNAIFQGVLSDGITVRKYSVDANAVVTKTDVSTAEIANISALFPTSGTDASGNAGGDYYDRYTAKMQIPDAMLHSGLVITYKSIDEGWVTEKLIVGNTRSQGNSQILFNWADVDYSDSHVKEFGHIFVLNTNVIKQSQGYFQALINIDILSNGTYKIIFKSSKNSQYSVVSIYKSLTNTNPTWLTDVTLGGSYVFTKTSNDKYLWLFESIVATDVLTFELQNVSDGVYKDITDIQGDITDIQGDITDIQGDITDIQGDITDIQGDNKLFVKDVYDTLGKEVADFSVTTMPSHRIVSSGAVQSSGSAWTCQEITNFSPGEVFRIKSSNLGPTGAYLYSIQDSNGNVLAVGPEWNVEADLIVFIPHNASKFYTMQSISGYPLSVFKRKQLYQLQIPSIFVDSFVDSPTSEFLFDWIDSQNRLLLGIKRDGTTLIPKLESPYFTDDTISVIKQALISGGLDISEKRPYKIKVDSSTGDCIIIMRYSKTQDFRITMGKCGLNNLYAIKKQEFVDNSNFELSDFSDSAALTITSGTDWVGPYVMTADQNGNGNSGFTGGFHGYNGDQTGSATARNISYAIYADNREAATDTEILCNEVSIVVVNNIQAGNTKEQDGSGREVLQETVTYHFLDGKIYVSLIMTPFEDIHIQTYYGMQISGYDSNVKIISTNKVMENTSPTTSMQCPYHSSDIIGKRSDNKVVVAHMDNVGLGNGVFSNTSAYAFFQSYGSSGKSYYSLVNGNVALPLGESFYWQGFYAFCENVIKTN